MTEKHRIEVEKDEEVAAVHHEADSDRWIFFCHGFGSDKEGSYEMRCERAVEEGWNAVRFDFRGNGDSDGDFIEQCLSSKIEDLESVIKFFEPEKFALFGSSFGGRVILESESRIDPVALICRAPVTYNKIMEKYRSVVEEKGNFTHHEGATIDSRFYEDFDSYSFDRTVQEIGTPAIIFHGQADSTVHIENSVKAFSELDTDVTIRKFENEKHSFSEKAESSMQDLMFYWLSTIES